MGDGEKLESGDAAGGGRSTSVWSRIQDHKIIQWGIGYLGAAFALAQGSDLVGKTFDWPEVVGRIVVLALIAGLPIALALAWYHGHRGLQRVSKEELGVLSALVLIGAVFFTAAFRLTDRADASAATNANAIDATAPGNAAAPQNAADAHPANSIAVLPFRNISSDPEQEYFVDGLSEELMNQLAQVRALRVTARTSAFAFKGSTETVDKIGGQLNVGHVLEGSVRKAGDQLVITAQLIDTTTGFNLWSKAYNRELKDIFAIQQDIAREVVSALKVTLGIDEDQRIPGGTDNLDAYALYLQATTRPQASIPTAQAALDLTEQALKLDPSFSLAWAHKARLLLFLRLDPRRSGPELQAMAEEAAQRAIELAPDSPVAHAVMANAASVRGDWRTSEAKYRQVFARGDPAERGGGYGLLRLAVGHLLEARDRLVLQRQRDPLNESAVAFLAAAEDSLGNTQAAIAELERGRQLFQPWTAGNYNAVLTMAGMPETNFRLNPASVGFSFENPAFAPIAANWDDPAAVRQAVRNAYASIDQSIQPLWRVLVRIETGALAARFGDPDLALKSFEDTFNSSPEQIYAIWRPVYRDMRKLPRFKQFARDVGLVDYWKQYGWPDLCRPVGENDFECD
jgi:adenylate cyclase